MTAAAARNPIAGAQWPLQPVAFNPQYRSQIPRFVVKIDGKTYLGTRFSYTQNAHGATDTARISLPIDGDANFPGIKGTSLYPDWTQSIKRSDELGNANAPVICEIWSVEPPDPSSFGPQNPFRLGPALPRCGRPVQRCVRGQRDDVRLSLARVSVDQHEDHRPIPE